MSRIKTATIHQKEKYWFFAASFLLVLSFIAYMYFVSASVVHVVMRKEIDVEINTLSSKISQLEAEYIEAQHTVSTNIATLQGYVANDAKIFIDRTQASLVLLQNTDGS